MAYGASADLVVNVIAKTDQAARELNTASGKFGKFGAGVKKLAVPAAIAGAAVVKFATDATSKASDLQQAMGGVQAVFGKNSGTITEWAKNAATQAGLSQTEYANMASALGASLKNAGLPLDQVTEKTGELISLGADLAATYGGTTADAVSALTGALRGEADPAERYGLALNATRVNAELASKGLDKLKGTSATTAKAATIIEMATKQAGGAIGQFGREADSAAGASEIAKAQWENAQATLGTALLPVVTKVTQALSKMAVWMAKHKTITMIVVAAVGLLSAAILILIGVFKILELVEKIQQSQAIATWAATLGPIALVIAAILAVIAIFVLLYKKVKWFRDFVNKVWAGIKTAAKAVGEALKQAFTSALDAVGKMWDGFKTAVSTVLNALKPIFRGAVKVFKTVWRVAKAIVVGYFRAYKTVVLAVFKAIKVAVRAVVAVFKTVWRLAVAVVKGYIRGWKTVITTVFNAIKTIIRTAAGVLKTAWHGAVEAVKTTVRGFKTFLSEIWTAVKTAIGTVKTKIVTVFTSALTWITNKWDGLEDTLTAPWDALKGVVDDISDAISDMIGWIGKIHFPSMPGWLDKVMPGMAPAPEAPSTRGVGAVVPLGTGRATATSGAGITIQVNGALDPEAVARQIRRILAGHDRRVGLRVS